MLITDHEFDCHRMDDDGGLPAPDPILNPLSVSCDKDLLVVNALVPSPDRMSVLIDGVLVRKEYVGSRSASLTSWTVSTPITPGTHQIQVIVTDEQNQQFVHTSQVSRN